MSRSKGLDNAVSQCVKVIEHKHTAKDLERIREMFSTDIWVYTGLISLEHILDGLIHAETDADRLKAVRAALKWRENYLH